MTSFGSRKLIASTILLVLAATAGAGVLAADWPEFRGPQRDGISGEKGFATDWPDAGLSEVWRRPLGEGFSGMSVVDGKLFTVYASGKSTFAAALDVKSGETVWRTKVGEAWVDRFGNGPRATPTIDGDVVFTLTARGNLHALKRSDGGVVWSRDLQEDYGARIPQWGISSSPLVVGKALLVNVGGKSNSAMVAFDKTSGKEMWKHGADEAGYAAPILMKLNGKEQVVFFTAVGLVSVDPKSGSEMWRHPWKTSYDVNAATPIQISNDQVFVSSGYDVGAALVRVGESGAEEVWRNRSMKNQFSSSVLHDGYIYGFDDKNLTCIKADTGESQWRARGFGHGSLFLADGHLIVLGDKGRLALVKAKPDAYQLVAEQKVFDGKTWTVPTLVDGVLFVRDEKELIAFDMKK